MFKTRLLVTITGLALCLAVPAQAKEKKIKCFVCNGQNICADTVPPECASNEMVLLQDGAKVKQSPKVQKTTALKDPAAEKARIEAERHDNAISTYASEKEIDLARDRNLQQVEARTGSYTILLKSAHENEVSLQKEAEGLTKQGRKLPKSLEEDLVEAKTRIAKLQGDLDNSLKEGEAVKARYEADKVRYRELKGIVTPKK